MAGRWQMYSHSVGVVVPRSGGRDWIASQREAAATEAAAARATAAGRADGAADGAGGTVTEDDGVKTRRIFRTVRSELPVDDRVVGTATMSAPEIWYGQCFVDGRVNCPACMPDVACSSFLLATHATYAVP